MGKSVKQKLHMRNRRRQHIRKMITGTTERPRLVVFRSNKQIYAQLVDDLAQKTICGTSSLCKDVKKDVEKAKSKVDQANIVGKKIAEIANDHKIKKVVFDRAGYLYKGRVKALAEGAREGGLEF